MFSDCGHKGESDPRERMFALEAALGKEAFVVALLNVVRDAFVARDNAAR